MRISELEFRRVLFRSPDHNALGKAAFIVGLIGLILSFIPLIGFVSWILGPLAILFGLIALLRKSRSLAIAGIVTGVLTLYVCYGWIKGTQSLGEAMNKDAFNTSGETFDMANAPRSEEQTSELQSTMRI